MCSRPPVARADQSRKSRMKATFDGPESASAKLASMLHSLEITKKYETDEEREREREREF